MSIVPDFAYDVFISYAHVNDQRIAEEDQGWVTDLHDVLSKKLLEEMRVRPKIWRDEGGLDGREVAPGDRRGAALERRVPGGRLCGLP